MGWLGGPVLAPRRILRKGPGRSGGADQAVPAAWRDYIGSSGPSAKATDFLRGRDFHSRRPGLFPGDFREIVSGGGRGQGTGGGLTMDWAQPSRSFRPADMARPLRLDHSAWIPVAWRVCRLRLRSQVAKAADCKSAIVGSTPTGASPPSPLRSPGFAGFRGGFCVSGARCSAEPTTRNGAPGDPSGGRMKGHHLHGI